MIEVGNLYSELERYIPLEYRYSWDNDGLMYCFNKNKAVGKVLVTLDVTLDSINYAVKNGFDTIVSHHPLIFKPISNLDFEGATGIRLKKIVEYDMTVMSFHTRLDCIAVNKSLADKLSITITDDLCLDGLPLGKVGELEQEMTVDEFAAYVKQRLGAKSVNFPKGSNMKIKRVAVLGGSGGDGVLPALKMSASALVTGECSYNKVLDAADCGLCVFTAGHFETENCVCKYLYDLITAISPDTECYIYNSDITDNV